MSASSKRAGSKSGAVARSRRRSLPLLAFVLASACSPLYVIRAGIEEARILSRRRPIAEVMADARTDTTTRRKLDLVLQARTFAEKELALSADASFTTYSWVESDTLLMVLSAARKDRFELYSWWFPIVGRVPYKGFFDFSEARAAAAELERKGYDTHVRPSGAFSTLGWFNDPVLNTVLRYGDVALVSTVIHELLHNTVFIASQVSFNESFANFVGDRGAAEFFCRREGAQSRRCTAARDAWQDNLVFGAFLSDLLAALERVYSRDDWTAAQRIAQREVVFQRERQRFMDQVRPRLLTPAFRDFDAEPLNNAVLVATRLYYDRLHLFEAAFERNGRDLVGTIQAIVELARLNPQDPFGALSRYVSLPQSLK